MNKVNGDYFDMIEACVDWAFSKRSHIRLSAGSLLLLIAICIQIGIAFAVARLSNGGDAAQLCVVIGLQALLFLASLRRVLN